MDDELINNFTKLLHSDKQKIKSLGNSRIFLQYGNSLSNISCDELLQLVDNYESRRLYSIFNAREKDEYIIVAYHNGDVIGTKIKIE